MRWPISLGYCIINHLHGFRRMSPKVLKIKSAQRICQNVFLCMNMSYENPSVVFYVVHDKHSNELHALGTRRCRIIYHKNYRFIIAKYSDSGVVQELIFTPSMNCRSQSKQLQKLNTWFLSFKEFFQPLGTKPFVVENCPHSKFLVQGSI